MTKIKLIWNSGEALAELNESENSKAVLEILPCVSNANTWGDEIYFEVPVTAELMPDAQEVVDPGTLCFWVEGKSIAIPFGPTPVSRGDECRLVTKVNILGKIEGDPVVLKKIQAGNVIRVEKL